LIEELRLDPPLAAKMVAAASDEAKRLEETAKKKQAERELGHQAESDQTPTEL
jgi:hypothetical protein